MGAWEAASIEATPQGPGLERRTPGEEVDLSVGIRSTNVYLCLGMKQKKNPGG